MYVYIYIYIYILSLNGITSIADFLSSSGGASAFSQGCAASLVFK